MCGCELGTQILIENQEKDNKSMVHFYVSLCDRNRLWGSEKKRIDSIQVSLDV